MSRINKISCIIVDDEISSQNVLKNYISKTSVLELGKVCSNVKEAYLFLQLHPDIELIFLDINMPNQSGVDFYKKLQNPPPVIFTTAYSQFAVQGFELNATDYLLKPFSYERFLAAVGKVIKNMDQSESERKYLILNENKILHKVLLEDILFLEAFGDYVKVVTSEKTITTHSTFKNMIKDLPSNFLKIHKSFSINLDKMKLISGNVLEIENHKIPIGPSYKAKVLKLLE